jgi:hypothetical protein
LRITLGIGAVAAVLAAAGCGGGDDEPTSASSGASGASGASGPQNVAGGDVSVSYAQPCSKSDKVGETLLRAVDVEGLASILSTTFEIPPRSRSRW